MLNMGRKTTEPRYGEARSPGSWVVCDRVLWWPDLPVESCHSESWARSSKNSLFSSQCLKESLGLLVVALFLGSKKEMPILNQGRSNQQEGSCCLGSHL